MYDYKISVIIAAFNAERNIREAMNSILTQPDIDSVEIIVIDDCSSDETNQILQSEYAGFDNICIIRNYCNMGPMYNYDMGIRMANGKYLIVLDSDDIYLPTAFRKMYDTAEYYHADVVMTSGYHVTYDLDDIQNIHHTELFQHYNKNKIMVIKNTIDDKVGLWCSGLFSLGLPMNIFSTDFLRKNQLAIGDGSDTDFILKCVLKSNVFVKIPDIFYVYRMRNTTHSHSNVITREYINEKVKGMVNSFHQYVKLMRFNDELKNRDDLQMMIKEHWVQIMVNHSFRSFYKSSQDNEDIKRWMRDAWNDCFYPYGEFVDLLFRKYALEC